MAVLFFKSCDTVPSMKTFFEKLVDFKNLFIVIGNEIWSNVLTQSFFEALHLFYEAILENHSQTQIMILFV
jgi:hypothetical protein